MSSKIGLFIELIIHNISPLFTDQCSIQNKCYSTQNHNLEHRCVYNKTLQLVTKFDRRYNW